MAIKNKKFFQVTGSFTKPAHCLQSKATPSGATTFYSGATTFCFGATTFRFGVSEFYSGAE